MKGRVFLLSALLFSAPMLSPALAQDNVIRVIQPDGSEAVVELPGAGVPSESAVPAAPRSPAAIEVIREPAQATPQVPPQLPSVPLQAVAPTSAAAKPVVAPAPTAPASAAIPPVDVPSKPSVKKAVVKAPVKPPKPKVKKAPIPPKDTGMAKVVTPTPESVPGDVIVTEKLAKRVALQVAPPASDMTVMYRTYEDKPVYLVRFKTEEGPFDVLVDMVSGDIVATKEP